MKRRRFIQTSIAAVTAPLILTQCQKDSNLLLNEKIKGFIFSDAHIGWSGKDQPSIKTQKRAIESIVDHFGDVDLVFDTGDVHHGNLPEKERILARDFWLSEMAGRFPTSLFHYIPGNHELGSGLKDAELTACQLGSFALRPYYSFDYKGIHFISLPELQDTILISQESLNWLKVDLELNKDKTTLIFSHNSLNGTTYNNDATGYRVIVNSDQVFNIINKHNNVIAWFHGHNHQYEIVNKHQRLYVSNGRIGGYNPPKNWGDFGQGHLGGVYFEIDSNGLTVKCFSATENDFFENIGKPHLSNQISNQTSFEPASPFNHYSGHGMIYGNNTYNFHNHYLSQTSSQVSVVNNPIQIINANHDLNYNTEYKIDRGTRNKLIGYQIKPKSVNYKKVDRGIQIRPTEDHPFYIKLPIENYKLGTLLGRSGYYRCGLGDRYQLDVEYESDEKLDISAQYKVLDKNHDVYYQSKRWLTGNNLTGSIRFDIDVPKQLVKKPQDQELYLFIRIQFNTSLNPMLLKSINLFPVQKENNDTEGKVSLAGQDFKYDNNTTKRLKLEHESEQIKLQNVTIPKTMYIKSPDIKWQVRNATATITDSGLIIHQLRHQFQKRSQIIITPTAPKAFYVNELINITGCQIFYNDNNILIHSIKYKPGSSITIFSKSPPLQTKGVELLEANKSRYFYKVTGQKLNLLF